MKQIVGNEREREWSRERAPQQHLGKKKEAKREMERARDMRVRGRSRVKEREKHREDRVKAGCSIHLRDTAGQGFERRETESQLVRGRGK